jgi:hypothetical protein
VSGTAASEYTDYINSGWSITKMGDMDATNLLPDSPGISSASPGTLVLDASQGWLQKDSLSGESRSGNFQGNGTYTLQYQLAIPWSSDPIAASMNTITYSPYGEPEKLKLDITVSGLTENIIEAE